MLLPVVVKWCKLSLHAISEITLFLYKTDDGKALANPGIIDIGSGKAIYGQLATAEPDHRLFHS